MSGRHDPALRQDGSATDQDPLASQGFADLQLDGARVCFDGGVIPPDDEGGGGLERCGCRGWGSNKSC